MKLSPIALAVNAAIARPVEPKKATVWTLRDALASVILAAEIHDDALSIKRAALHAYWRVGDPIRDALLLIIDHRDPVAMVERILMEELEL